MIFLKFLFYKLSVHFLVILFVDKGMAASSPKMQQMALVDIERRIPPPNFLSKSGPSAICRISSETRSTMRIRNLLVMGSTSNLGT